VAMQSYDNIQIRPQRPRHFAARRDERNRVSRNAGPWHQSPVVGRRTLRHGSRPP
jgi:hypothetical protein